MAKGGGSQLSQLRAKLHSSGVSDRRQASKKSRQRHGGQDEKDAAANRRNKIQAIVGTLNPFDEKVTKPKHEVLGRKIKGAVGRPGAAKASGLAQRRATLLPEWEARNRTGAFVDRRFGENDANMTPEDKMLERYATEKQRRSAKGAAFNLNDDDELLTHYGQSLAGMDDLADIRLADEDDEEQDGRLSGKGHFGGFDDDEKPEDGSDKTKAEVMRELIAKSKYHKIERQKVKDADDDLREQLDDDLADIRGLLYQQPALTATEEAVNPKASISALANGTDLPVIDTKKPSSSYDVFVREMAFERRAKPQDRLKSEAEMAADQAQRLQKAEKARLKRMRGDSDDEGEDDEDDTEQNGGRKKRKRAANSAASAKRSGQADDLDDDFELDGMTAGDVYGLGAGLTEDVENSDEEDEDEEGNEEDDGEEVASSAASDGDDDEDDFADLADIEHAVQIGEDEDSEREGEHEALTSAVSTSKKRKTSDSKTSSAPVKVTASTSKVPYTFPCPATHDELLATLDAHKIEPRYIPIVVKRIRTLYHASLSEDNKYKLQAFIGVLIDHALHWAGQAQQPPSSSEAAQHRKLSFAIVNALVAHIFSLSRTYPLASAQHFVSKLALMQRNLSRGLAKGATDPNARTWPGLAEMTLLRLVGSIWPTSDRQHPVTTPLMLLIAQYLGHARIRSLSDIAAGLFLTSLIASHQKESKRLVPEALNFLYSAIAILAPLTDEVKSVETIRQTAEEYGIPAPDVDAAHTQHLRLSTVDAAVDTSKAADLPSLMTSQDDQESEHAAAVLLNLSTTVLMEFAEMYQGSTSFVELFTPFSTLFSQIPSTSCVSDTIRMDMTRQLRLAASSRRFLRLQAHRAIPIATQVPKFDQQGFNPDRKGALDPDADRVQMAKMKALIKKERKGAIRELRKDNQFIAGVKNKEREDEDRSYKKKMDKIMSTLQDERSEQKQMEKAKANIKRRAGKK